ncbi:unnamed protein product [Cuscuta campestris]|uniref:Retrotransposon gag domain-containing protein n=1 Tax=Cuscuta campestris TaxID=132261 RepID=A0A484MMV9_9ASTE|nr:unnamed protein product [Cuscuta campestris]
MSNESQTMSHEELIASNAALKAQVEYLAKELAKLTKMKLNELQGSDREEDANSSGTVKPKANEGSDFKVDILTFEGKNDPDEFLEWLETVERVFDFKDVSDEKKVKIVALKFRKYASTWWTNTCTKRRRNDKESVSTWAKMKSLLKKKFLPAEYVRENFAKLQTLRQECSNKHAIPYEEWTKDDEENCSFEGAINDTIPLEEPTLDEEMKSSDNINIPVEDVFDFHVEYEEEVIIDELISRAPELPNHALVSNADDYETSFVFYHFVKIGMNEEVLSSRKYAKDDHVIPALGPIIPSPMSYTLAKTKGLTLKHYDPF